MIVSNLRINSHEVRRPAKESADMRQIVIDLPGGADESGWPPVSTERVWAKQLQGERFRIDNVPFFAKGISLGDVVTVWSDEDTAHGSARLREIVVRGGHSTYRVIVFADLDTDRHDAYHLLLNALYELGTTIEVGGPRVFAVDVPPEVNSSAIYDVLRAGEEEHIWDFEEGDYQTSDVKPERSSAGWARADCRWRLGGGHSSV